MRVAPYVCLIADGPGTVYGCGKVAQMRGDIAAHLEPARLAALRAVRPADRTPARRLVSLLGFLRALGACARNKPQADSPADEALSRVSSSQLADRSGLFEWLDREARGSIGLEDVVRASASLVGAEPPAQGETGEILPLSLGMFSLCRSEAALAEAMRSASSDASIAGAEGAGGSGSSGSSAASLSRESFMRLMALHAARESKQKLDSRGVAADVRAAHFVLGLNDDGDGEATDGEPTQPTRAGAVRLMRRLMDKGEGDTEHAEFGGVDEGEEEAVRRLEAAIDAFEGRVDGTHLSLAAFANLIRG